MIRVLGLWFLMVLLFAGHIGIPVYKHICSEDGEFTSFFIPNNSHCTGQEEENVPSCCSQETKKKDCCHNETKIYKLQTDYAVSFAKFEFPNHEFVASKYFDFSTINLVLKAPKTTVVSMANPPPLLYGKQLLIRHQVFRI